MAKKDPSELSVEERLKTLYQLQTALSSIDEKRALRGELPLEVQDLEDEIEGLTTLYQYIYHIFCHFHLMNHHLLKSAQNHQNRLVLSQ